MNFAGLFRSAYSKGLRPLTITPTLAIYADVRKSLRFARECRKLGHATRFQSSALGYSGMKAFEAGLYHLVDYCDREMKRLVGEWDKLNDYKRHGHRHRLRFPDFRRELGMRGYDHDIVKDAAEKHGVTFVEENSGVCYIKGEPTKMRSAHDEIERRMFRAVA